MFQSRVSDSQFLMMKINRLEGDLAATQQELLKTRHRLLTAEESQFKYQHLMKQSQKADDVEIAEMIEAKIADRDRYWSQKEKQTNNKYISRIKALDEEILVLKKKNQKKSVKFEDQDLLLFKNKKLQAQTQQLESQLSNLKKQYTYQKDQEIKIAQDTLITQHRDKQETQRKIYRQKIDHLQKTIESLQQNLKAAEQRANPERQNQIHSLKQKLKEKADVNMIELEKVSSAFADRDNEMKKLLQEREKAYHQLLSENHELRENIKYLEGKILEKEKEQVVEQINLKEKMSRLREEQVGYLKQQLKKNEESFQLERNSWDTVLEDKEAELERILKKSEDDLNRHKEDKAKKNKKIEELKERLKQFEGEKEIGQTENLIKSLKDLENREADFANYENGVTFLDRQLKRSINKIEQKNIEISKLVNEINQVRNDYEMEMNELKERNRKDKKYYTDKMSQLECEIRNLNETMRGKEKEYKKKQKDQEAEIVRFKNQSKSYRQLVDEMQKDYNRVLDNKKSVQNSYRQERQKGLTSKSDLALAKKQKWLELERQKNELEVIFKEKQQQLQTKFEVERQALRHQRDKLQAENFNQKAIIEDMKNSCSQSQNKENLQTDYHKQMVTLNLEIALTKNIYDSLRQAKAKVSNKREFEMIEENSSQNEPSIKISPARQEGEPPFMNASDFEKMGMSFNPKFK